MKRFSQTSPVDAFNWAVNFQTVASLLTKSSRPLFDALFFCTASVLVTTIQVVRSYFQNDFDARRAYRLDTPLSDPETLCAFKPILLRIW